MKDQTSLLEQIANLIGSSPDVEPYAAFDFDNTCIVNDIAEATLNHMARQALFRNASVLPDLETANDAQRADRIFRHYYRLLAADDVLGAYEFGAKTLGGLRTAEIAPLVAAVIKAEGETIGTTELYGQKIAKGLAARLIVINLIRALQQLNVKIWVVSASPRLLVAEAMKHFGIDAELIGIRQKIADGVITPELEAPLSVMGGKVDCIKLFIDPTRRPVLGVGDSMNDGPMLEYCDLKAVVNRGNALAKKAEAEGWTLLAA